MLWKPAEMVVRGFVLHEWREGNCGLGTFHSDLGFDCNGSGGFVSLKCTFSDRQKISVSHQYVYSVVSLTAISQRDFRQGCQPKQFVSHTLPICLSCRVLDLSSVHMQEQTIWYSTLGESEPYKLVCWCVRE